jgi:hypothetical protein
VAGRQLPPPAFVSQIWNAPLLDSTRVISVVGKSVQVAEPIAGSLAPDRRAPTVIVRVWLPLPQV